MSRERAGRVAALYDIHGNVPALEAVLSEVEGAGVELVVVGGDVAWGPMPREALEIVTQLEARTLFVRGNADREVAARDLSGDRAVAAVTLWCADQLAPAHLEFMAA